MTAHPTSSATRSASFRRAVAAIGLVAAAVTSLGWTLLAPPFPDGFEERLAAIDEGGATATASAVLFSVSQLFMLVAVLAIAHLARRGAPVLSAVGAGLGILGVLGHAVFGGVSLMTVAMAADVESRGIHAALVEDFESSPMMVFAAAGLLGTVLGVLVLAIALFRSRAVPRWIPSLLVAFLVVEFVGTGLSDQATYASGLCLLLAFGGLAAHVLRTPASDWDLPPVAPTGQPAPVPA